MTMTPTSIHSSTNLEATIAEEAIEGERPKIMFY